MIKELIAIRKERKGGREGGVFAEFQRPRAEPVRKIQPEEIYYGHLEK